jgi:ribosomal protein L11 methyltransferase
MPSTTRARLTGDESLVKRVAALVSESIEDAVTAAFEDAQGAWAAELHFAAPPDENMLRELIVGAGGDHAALTFEQIAEQDWVAASLAGLKPVAAGRFAVHGSHDRGAIKPNVTGIEIEAALAFGTGHHGTTRGCLLALDALAKRGRLRRVLDVGTGTGVLAIAAARTFHTPIVATDIDPVAVAAARSNARLNRVPAFVNPKRAVGPRGIGGRYDLIFANILLGPLTRMASPLAKLAAPGASVVLSGLMPSQANAALSAYRAQGLVLEGKRILEDWATLTMRRPKRKPPRPRPRRFR